MSIPSAEKSSSDSNKWKVISQVARGIFLATWDMSIVNFAAIKGLINE